MKSNPYKQLNRELYDEISKPDRALSKVKDLLARGADPLGCYEEGNEDCVLESFILDQNESEDFHDEDQVIQLFFDYGMKIIGLPPEERWMYDDELHPLWDLGFVQSEKGIRMLKVFLDNQIDTDIAEDCADHVLLDISYVDGWRENDAWWYEGVCYGLKMVMLIASYEDHLKKSKYLPGWVDYENNDHAMLPRFRNWNANRYEIDTSTARNLEHGLADATLTIFDKESGEQIWKMSIQ